MKSEGRKWRAAIHGVSSSLEREVVSVSQSGSFISYSILKKAEPAMVSGLCAHLELFPAGY